MTQQRLTIAEANEIGGVLQQLTQLNTKSIVEKDDAATKRALAHFLQTKLLLHAEEFLAAWFTLKQEYEPYLMAQASMLGNVMLVIQRRQQIMEAQAQAKAPATAEARIKGNCDAVIKESEDTPPAAPEPAQEPANVIQLNPK
jgi:hypothetical protein